MSADLLKLGCGEKAVSQLQLNIAHDKVEALNGGDVTTCCELTEAKLLKRGLEDNSVAEPLVGVDRG